MIDLPPDDIERLITQLKVGKNSAYKQLQDLVKPWLYSVIHQNLGPHKNDADDVYQEVMLQVFSAIKGFREDSKLSTWICRIAINRCRNRHRHHKARKKGFEEQFDEHKTVNGVQEGPARPDEVLEARQLQELVVKAVDQLSEKHRIVWILRRHGFSYEEIGEIVSLPIGTVRSRLHRSNQEVALVVVPQMAAEPEKES
jgi:RNA polymerase sigma-70 factor (ECF subfamily)